MGNLVCSDNRVLDYLINSKLCSLENTQVVISGSVGDLSDIADTDLACLMGNILDNAIDAINSVPEKRIELLFSLQNMNRIIICKNTIVKSVLATNPQLNSTKRASKNHGYGMKIISEIVEKHHGMIDYFEEFDMFGIQIILPKPSENE
jgi:sensor histidine kinase regulating citrate/malate metabolism